MPRGGARPGAGRKRGNLNERSRKVAERALASDAKTPLEVMLLIMRMHMEDKAYDKAAAIAKDAAPYMHVKPVAPPPSASENTVIVVRGGMKKS